MLGPPVKQLIPRGEGRSQCSIIFRSVYCSSLLYFACVCMLFATFSSWVPLILFLLFSRSQQIIFVQCQGAGVNFERNVVLTKQDHSVGRISGFVQLVISGMHLTCGLNFYCHSLYAITVHIFFTRIIYLRGLTMSS